MHMKGLENQRQFRNMLTRNERELAERLAQIENGDDEHGAVGADGTVDAYQIDAEMADMIIQYAIFGEVIFG